MIRKYKISGMSCAACSKRIFDSVNKLNNVEHVEVNLLSNSMTVDGNVLPENVIAAVRNAGYGCALSTDSLDEFDNEKELKIRIKKLITSTVFLLILIYMSTGRMLFNWPVPNFLKSNEYAIGFVCMMLALVMIFINVNYFVGGIKGILRLAPNMDSLVALGSGVSFVYSVVLLINKNEELYFTSSAMILVMISFGKLMECYSKGKTTNALKSLVSLAPEYANVIRDDKEEKILAELVEKGDIFVVKPGEKFPVDGVICGVIDANRKMLMEQEDAGQTLTTTDESMLTGESRPVAKYVNDEVYATTINLSGYVRCEATKVGADTSFSKIVQMVNDASNSKAPIAKIADRVAGIFVPAVIIIAAITFAVWMVVGNSLQFALSRAIAVLVISCPCSLGLATPVAIMVGNGIAAKQGILFKNASVLEICGQVKAVVFDKTGTITYGNATQNATSKDEIKPDSKQAVLALKQMDIQVFMLSGDKPEIAFEVARKTGIDNVVAGVTPEGKSKEIMKIKSKHKVMMVGDGINDSPSLTLADVGVAVANGTDVAIDSADIVLMKNSLKDVVGAINISRATMKIIKENLFWAFFYNLLAIPVAAGALYVPFGITLSPMLGALCMGLSSFCVVANALRLNAKKLNLEQDHDEETNTKGMDKEMNEIILDIEGMMCKHCEARVKKCLEAFANVKNAEVSHEKNMAVVMTDGLLDVSELINAVENEGYKAKQKNI